MPKFSVFHNPDFLDAFRSDAPRIPHLSRLVHVADVECEALSKVFNLTNTLEAHWSLNPGVTAHDPRARSTSVGDLVRDESGNWWMCAPVGWTSVPAPSDASE